jgi:DNA-binding response OmpR family regulator
MEKLTILVVEDDPAILMGLKDLLSSENYTVITACDGRLALAAYRDHKPDLILLDIMMPEKSGYEVLKEIRREDAYTPILMLTAKSQEIDKVIGLELGADDYIVKPFGMQELLARIKSVWRRSREAVQNQKNRVTTGAQKLSRQPVAFGDVTVDPKSYTLCKGSKSDKLSKRELSLLYYLIEHAGEVIDRNTLLEAVWELHYAGTTRTVDQHIVKLRQKIEADPASPRYIETVHTVGYRFTAHDLKKLSYSDS